MRKVIKIEQNALALPGETCAKVSLGVYGEAVAVDVHWNEQLAGWGAFCSVIHTGLATQMGVQIGTGWGPVPPAESGIITEFGRGTD